MSNTSFNPNNIRMEELFRAKEERRRRLAKLSLEEKIDIVKKLQSVSSNNRNEKLIFDSFLKVCPQFANEPLLEWALVDEWYAKHAPAHPPAPFDRRPDIIALTASARRIGIELKSWLNRGQITEGRKQERIHAKILKALTNQHLHETQHLSNVLLSAKQLRFEARDAADFRDQMFRLVEEMDNRWPSKPAALRNASEDHDDLSNFPLLEKYLRRIRFKPAPEGSARTQWLKFSFPSGGHFSPYDMRETLRSALFAHRSDSRYKDLKTKVCLDEVVLLVHYDFKAFAYNTPFDAPGFGFKEAAQFASKILDDDCGYFDRIFLFRFLPGQEEAYELCP